MEIKCVAWWNLDWAARGGCRWNGASLIPPGKAERVQRLEHWLGSCLMLWITCLNRFLSNVWLGSGCSVETRDSRRNLLKREHQFFQPKKPNLWHSRFLHNQSFQLPWARSHHGKNKRVVIALPCWWSPVCSSWLSGLCYDEASRQEDGSHLKPSHHGVASLSPCLGMQRVYALSHSQELVSYPVLSSPGQGEEWERCVGLGETT